MGPDERVELHGFNNLTKAVSFNLYEFVVARTEAERTAYLGAVHERFGAAKIASILTAIARIIDAEVLSVSSQDYRPTGASALALMSDLGHGSVAAHLTKSHLCAHTYPDTADPRGLCSFRVDIDLATCGTIVPLRALDFMLDTFEADVAIIDYVVRGFARDSDGRRIYMDHHLRSIQDFIAPERLAGYHCEDLVIARENIWQTKMLRTRLDPDDYFAPGTDVDTPENREALAEIGRQMAEIFGGAPA
jgi:S-adenosylmethionine decarboxylase